MADVPKSLPEREQEILAFWEKNYIFKKSLEKKSPKGNFVFYDGPPFATGLPHYGHILASTIKDVVPRYWTMKGYHVRRVWGWDCHGLPIENIVEKQLKISGKKQIEEKGIDVFNDTCRNAVLTYASGWEKMVKRIGRWVDFEHSYKTMDAGYMESVWWAVKKIWEKGLLYEGRKVLLYCPRCETPISNFEVAMDNSYQDVTEEAVTVKFKVKNPAAHDLPANTFILAWTTTPWTLPGNVALAVGADMNYIVVKKDNEHLVLAEELAARIVGGDAEMIKKMKGKNLEGVEYEPLFAIPALTKTGKKSHYVTTADFVTTEEGTGVVHTAVVYGEDDYRLGLERDLPVVPLVDAQGHFNADAPEAVRGVYFKKAERIIKQDLEDRGLLFDRKQVTHSYPFCWRCSTQLFYNAIPAWFINIQKIKSKLLKLNETINWYPEHLKHGRFKNGIEGAPDWNISRNRYWATAIPIWKCETKECGALACIGSIDELRSRATNFKDIYGDETDLEKIDLHKPNIDRVLLSCEKCGKTIRRIPEVIDCWVESASMPFAELHAPFENEELFAKRYPAHFVAEYIAQTRAWFYVMHVIGTILFGKAPFKNVVTTGTVLNEKGEKLSKSKQNFPDPNVILEKYGADALRFYLMTSVVMKADNLLFNEREVDEVQKKVLNLVTNVVAFYQQYKDAIRPLPKFSCKHILDAWILARLSGLVKEVTEQMDGYDTVVAGRAIRAFIDDLSTWFLRRSRERFKTKGEDARAALTTLRHVLLELSKVMAPFTPFIAEQIYQAVGGGEESVHLESWPKVEKKLLDEKLLGEMGRVRSIVSRALERRAEAGRNVRQVLARMIVTLPEGLWPDGSVGPGGKLEVAYVDLLKDEVNVKEIEFKKGEYTVELDLHLTPELVREGTIREIIRRVNAMRKNAKLTIQDRIELYIESKGPEIAKALEEHRDDLLSGTLATSLRTSGTKPLNTESFRVNEFDLTVGFEKK